jgi:hypothetical protein
LFCQVFFSFCYGIFRSWQTYVGCLEETPSKWGVNLCLGNHRWEILQAEWQSVWMYVTSVVLFFPASSYEDCLCGKWACSFS